MRKSIARTIVFRKEINGKYGPSYLFEITFDNGDKGDYFAKSNPQTDFKEGVEIEYKIESKQNGNYTNTTITLPNKGNGFGGGKSFNPTAQNRQVALTNAVNLVIAGKVEEKQLIQSADKLFKWLNGNGESNTSQP